MVSRLHLRRRAAYYLLKMGGATRRKRVFQAACEEDAVQIRIHTNAYMYRYNNIICQQVNPQVPLGQREITEVFQIQHRKAHFLKLIPSLTA